ncbi:MAG: hypothetical protein AAFY30_15405, partial [Cyanobacteria bacterium J06642_12]
LHKGIERIIDAYAEDLIEKSEFEPRLRGMRERLKVLEAQLKTLQDEEALANELKLVISRVEEFAAKVAEGLETLSWTDKREVIRTLVKCVEVYPETIKVIFRIGTAPLVSKNKTKDQFSPHTCAGIYSRSSLSGAGGSSLPSRASHAVTPNGSVALDHLSLY